MTGFILGINKLLFKKNIDKLIKASSNEGALLIFNSNTSVFPILISCLILLFCFFIAKIQFDWLFVVFVFLSIVAIIIFFALVFLSRDLMKYSLNNKDYISKIELEKKRAELEGLKSQLDSHFLFNSLNLLSFLIENDNERAVCFNQNLVDVYKYISSNKCKGLVSLEEEIDFSKKYFSLLKIRFGENIDLKIHENTLKIGDYLLPPISLQMLIENVIKHNDLNDRSNLEINIYIYNNKVIISNKLRICRNKPPTSGIGLMNLNKRFELLMDRKIEFYTNNGYFDVHLPIINKWPYERFVKI